MRARLEVAAPLLAKRLAQPLLALAAALVGVSALLTGGFSRFGIWRQVGLAVVLLIVVQFLNNAAGSVMQKTPSLWAVAYLPSAVGVAISAVLLWWAGRPRRLRRSRTEAAA